MGKNRKAKPVRVKNPQRTATIRRAVLHTLAAIVFVALLGAGIYRVKGYVERNLVTMDRPPRVVIKSRPVWMSDALAAQIIRGLQPTTPSSPFDKQLLVDTVNLLSRNPWIRATRSVRRAYDKRPGDVLEIDCDFRTPLALVKWLQIYWLVDTEGVKLPQEFTEQQLPAITRGDDGRLNIRVIEGVAEAPVESGNKWLGPDLAAGMNLVKLLFGQSYAEEITRVDVSNFGGRVAAREAQITLVTRYNTSIRWGLPIDAKDSIVEVPTAQKLKRLERIWSEFHRVDAGRQSIDIRMDEITYPSMDTGAQTDARH